MTLFFFTCNLLHICDKIPGAVTFESKQQEQDKILPEVAYYTLRPAEMLYKTLSKLHYVG